MKNRVKVVDPDEITVWRTAQIPAFGSICVMTEPRYFEADALLQRGWTRGWSDGCCYLESHDISPTEVLTILDAKCGEILEGGRAFTARTPEVL